MTEFSGAQGRARLPAAGVGAVRRRARRAARRRPAGRLRRHRAADLRGHRAVRPRRRRVHRRGVQGDVHVRRPRRPVGDAAARGHRRRDARGDRARAGPRPAAGQAVLRGAVLPLRAPAGRPLPPAAAGRRRGDRRRRPRAGRRGDRDRRRGFPLARPRRVPAGDHLAGRRHAAARSTGSCCRSSCSGSTSTRTPAGAPRSTRCGCSTTSAPHVAGS